MQRHYNGQDAPNWTIDDIRKATGVGAAELAEARVIGETTLKTEVTISSSPSFLAEVKQATERHQRVSINQSASNGHFGLDGLSNIAGGKIEHLFELTEHKATCANDYRASFSTENSSVPIYSALDPAGLAEAVRLRVFWNVPTNDKIEKVWLGLSVRFGGRCPNQAQCLSASEGRTAKLTTAQQLKNGTGYSIRQKPSSWLQLRRSNLPRLQRQFH